MREAKYQARVTKKVASPPAPVAPVAPPVKKAAAASKPKVAAAATAEAAAPASDELCGHRSINGRTCTREKGHSAKNHRYS